MSKAPVTETATTPPSMPREEMIRLANELPRRNDRVLVLPLGGSTFRWRLVDRQGRILMRSDLTNPHYTYDDLTHATAAACVAMGLRPSRALVSVACPLPKTGDLDFSNLKWPAVGRTDLSRHLEISVPDDGWFNDGQAGYQGLELLTKPDDFVTLYEGSESADGEGAYGYGVIGTGLNMGRPDEAREDGHIPFAAKTTADFEYGLYLFALLGHWPSYEEAASGGKGLANSAAFDFHRGEAKDDRKYYNAFFDAPEEERGRVVVRFALEVGSTWAQVALDRVIRIMFQWLGSMAIAHQVQRIDICPGLLAAEGLWDFVQSEIDFLHAFTEQGGNRWRNYARGCTLRLCRRNPEEAELVRRAAELLRHKWDGL